MLSVIGIGIGGYLTYTHYAGLHVLCLSSGGCETVQHSTLLQARRHPGGHARSRRLHRDPDLALRSAASSAAPLGFGLALVGFLFSMYLTYREAFTIHAYCQWCLGSATVMTLLAILTAIRMLRFEPAPAAPRKPVSRAERRRQLAGRR